MYLMMFFFIDLSVIMSRLMYFKTGEKVEDDRRHNRYRHMRKPYDELG